MRLSELQAAVQQRILDGSGIDPNLIQAPPDSRRDKAFEVYQYAYFSRLEDFLRNDYEKLRSYIGDDNFSNTAKSYAQQYPSRRANARWFGQHFPEYLKESPLFAQHPVVHEIAELERALNDSFDAPDAPILTMSELAALGPERFGALSFGINPSLRQLLFWQNTSSIWSALACEEAPPAAFKLSEPFGIMVWRQNGASRFRLVSAQESMALGAAARGTPFRVICEMIAFDENGEDAAATAASYLRGWIEAELVSEFLDSIS